MSGKGDKRRPGSGYEDGWSRIWGRRAHISVKTQIECPHCGYIDTQIGDLLKEASNSWICPACEVCSMVYTTEDGDIWKVKEGYHREVPLDIET